MKCAASIRGSRRRVAAGTTYSVTWLRERAIELRRLRLILLFGALLMPRDRVLATRLLIVEPLLRLLRRLRNAVGAKKGGNHPIPADPPGSSSVT
jgi:hypothetical protein